MHRNFAAGRFSGTREEDPYGPWESQEKARGRSEAGPGIHNGSGEWQTAVRGEAEEVILDELNIIWH